VRSVLRAVVPVPPSSLGPSVNLTMRLVHASPAAAARPRGLGSPGPASAGGLLGTVLQNSAEEEAALGVPPRRCRTCSLSSPTSAVSPRSEEPQTGLCHLLSSPTGHQPQCLRWCKAPLEAFKIVAVGLLFDFSTPSSGPVVRCLHAFVSPCAVFFLCFHDALQEYYPAIAAAVRVGALQRFPGAPGRGTSAPRPAT